MKKKMSADEFEWNMKEIFDCADLERAHGRADDFICDLLISLGYKKGVKVFKESKKWYA